MKKVFIKLWGMPLLSVVCLLYGLISALAGDGAWDAVAWLFLLLPVLIAGRHYFKRREN